MNSPPNPSHDEHMTVPSQPSLNLDFTSGSVIRKTLSPPIKLKHPSVLAGSSVSPPPDAAASQSRSTLLPADRAFSK